MTRLMIVRPGKVLHWPPSISTGRDKLRGREGYVLDMDAPFEDEWTDGQLYKLEPADGDCEVDAITDQKAIIRLKSLEAKPKVPAISEKAEELGISASDETEEEDSGD